MKNIAVPRELKSMDDRKLYDLNFAVEVSARYHEWRRMFLERWIMSVRIISAAGAVLSLIGLSTNWSLSFHYFTFDGSAFIAIGSIAVAVVNIVDFVVGADHMARHHAELYRRFKELQERITRKQSDWKEYIAEWEADAQAIRRDEPPTLWALYMTSWNQAVERRDPKKMVGARKISRWQRWFMNLRHYLPRDFPVAKPKARTPTLKKAPIVDSFAVRGN